MLWQTRRSQYFKKENRFSNIEDRMIDRWSFRCFTTFREDSVDEWDTISSVPVRSIARGSYASWREAMLARVIPAETVDRAERVPTASASSVCAELATGETIAKRLPILAGRILVSTEVYAWERNLGNFHFHRRWIHSQSHRHKCLDNWCNSIKRISTFLTFYNERTFLSCWFESSSTNFYFNFLSLEFLLFFIILCVLSHKSISHFSVYSPIYYRAKTQVY